MSLMRGRLDPAYFASAIHAELQDYSDGWRTRGGSSPVVVTGATTENVGVSDIRRLINLTRASRVSPEMFRYAIDAIIMDEKLIVDDELFDALCSFVPTDFGGDFYNSSTSWMQTCKTKKMTAKKGQSKLALNSDRP